MKPVKKLLKISVITTFLFSDLPDAIREWYSEFHSNSSAADEKVECDVGEVTFVYSTRKGCSGKNLTPEQASDLLVSLLR